MSQNTQFCDSLLSPVPYCFTEAFIFLKFLQWFLKWHKWHIFVVVTRLLENLTHLEEQMSNLLYVWYLSVGIQKRYYKDTGLKSIYFLYPFLLIFISSSFCKMHIVEVYIFWKFGLKFIVSQERFSVKGRDLFHKGLVCTWYLDRTQSEIWSSQQ